LVYLADGSRFAHQVIIALLPTKVLDNENISGADILW